MSPTGLRKATEDLRERTLKSVPGEIARLVYLASTRDYSTGRYYHEGLAFRFSNEIAEMALESLHREVFEKLVLSSLEFFVQELDAFIRSTCADPKKVMETWKELQPYRVIIPQNCDCVADALFFSNIRIALAILESRQSKTLQQDQQSASLPQ